jgi:peroxiredoxin
MVYFWDTIFIVKKMFKRLKTRQFWLRLLRDAIVIISIIFIINLYQTRNTPELAPQLEATLISGESISLSTMLEQSPVMVYFWGSWCPMCSVTSSTVAELAKNNQVITVALSSGNQQQVQQYLKENDYQFAVVNDPDGEVSQTWGVTVTPTFFIINRQGKVSSVTTGISSSWGLRFRLWLASVNA